MRWYRGHQDRTCLVEKVGGLAMGTVEAARGGVEGGACPAAAVKAVEVAGAKESWHGACGSRVHHSRPAKGKAMVLVAELRCSTGLGWALRVGTGFGSVAGKILPGGRDFERAPSPSAALQNRGTPMSLVSASGAVSQETRWSELSGGPDPKKVEYRYLKASPV